MEIFLDELERVLVWIFGAVLGLERSLTFPCPKQTNKVQKQCWKKKHVASKKVWKVKREGEVESVFT